jgi:Tol biopolymer transport system component/serine/threonine protein kinase
LQGRKRNVFSLLSEDNMPEIGQTISHYRIVKKIGSGGMGVIYKARDLHLDRFVVLKTLSPERIPDPEHKKRFVQEAKAASALNHPGIVHIYDITTDAGVDFIAMEYVEGKTLDELIDRRGLGLNKALKYAIQISDALSKAHSAGIIHRDLKPSNIMVKDDGNVKILDFGLAKLMEQVRGSEFSSTATTAAIEKPVTDEGAIVGTVAYMSPEQAEGKPIDQRSDIFSFGSLLYEMITGRKAFQGSNKISTLSAIISKAPVPFGPEISYDLEKTIIRCLQKDKDRRFQNFADLKVILQELKEESDTKNRISITPSLSIKHNRLHIFHKTILLPILLIIMVVLALWLYFRIHSNLNWNVANEVIPSGDLALLVSSKGGAADPALSPDGKMLAFIAKDQDRWDLFVGRVAGRDHIRLTNDDAIEAMPSFSPDGERIVFTRQEADQGQPEIWIVPTLGRQAVRVIDSALDATWSPDGQKLAFVLRRPGEEDAIATSTIDGTNISIVMKADATYPFFLSPSWSPNGKNLAVARSSGGVAGELWLVPLDGGSPLRLTNDPPGINSHNPVFTPDGRGLIHESNRAGATNLWLLSLDDRRLTRLTSGPGPDRMPSVAEDGSIVFVNVRSSYALILRNLVDGQIREVLAHSTYLWAPVFSPSGQELAFSRAEQDGAWHIWIVGVQGGTPRQLTSGTLPEIYPRFTPDGASIVYHTWSSGPDRIWRVSLDGGPPVALTPARNDDDQYGDVSPDGQWLAFARTENEITRIYVTAINNGETRQLIDIPSTLPRWSPDGQWIAFSQSRGYIDGISVVDADGAGIRRISETGGWPVWWPDGKQLGYQNLGKDGSAEITIAPFADGIFQALSSLPLSGLNNPFDVSPDGTMLATSSSEVLSSDIWLLEPR